MIDKILNPEEPFISVHAFETINEIIKDDEDNPCHENDQRGDLYKGSLDTADK